MTPFAGKRLQVDFRVDKFVSEETGEMVHMTNTVALKNVHCSGLCTKNCPRCAGAVLAGSVGQAGQLCRSGASVTQAVTGLRIAAVLLRALPTVDWRERGPRRPVGARRGVGHRTINKAWTADLMTVLPA